MTTIPARLLSPSLLLLVPLCAVSCGSSTPVQSTTTAEVTGPADTHCGTGATMTVQTTGTCLTNDPPANASMCGVTFAPDTSAGESARMIAPSPASTESAHVNT